jgi:hypothetical protein
LPGLGGPAPGVGAVSDAAATVAPRLADSPFVDPATLVKTTGVAPAQSRIRITQKA